MALSKTSKHLLMAALTLAGLAGAGLTLWLYLLVYAPNVKLETADSLHIHIPTGSSYRDIRDLLKEKGIVRNMNRFGRLARYKNYPNRPMPGRYLLHHNMGNNQLINLLRSGAQDPVNLIIANVRTPAQLAHTIGRQIEADSLSIALLLSDQQLMADYGVDTLTGQLLFIPNTYEVYWTVSPRGLLERMHREYQAFWNGNRLEKARQAGLTPLEVGILASIVDRETSRAGEMPRIAGVYINRLRRGIPLQADPTVVYALGDFSIRRVLNHHLEVDSPYNTYLYAGLPPGPISLPGPGALDAVLDFEEHEYLFFCARDDFSGYHAFARTYREHLVNARRYRRALDERNIRR